MGFNSGFKGLNGLVHFAERRNLVSSRVPSHFNWPLLRAQVFQRDEASLGLFLDTPKEPGELFFVHCATLEDEGNVYLRNAGKQTTGRSVTSLKTRVPSNSALWKHQLPQSSGDLPVTSSSDSQIYLFKHEVSSQYMAVYSTGAVQTEQGLL